MSKLFNYAVLLLLSTPLMVLFVPVHELMYRFGMLDIDMGQKVMICGASSGIGEQMAYQYARKGAHLALVARRKHELSIVAESALDLGAASATPIVGDFAVGDETALLELVESATAAMSVGDDENDHSLDVLVLNHAVQRWDWFLPPKAALTDFYDTTSSTTSDESTSASLLGEAWSFDFINKSLEINLSSFIKLAVVAMPSLMRAAEFTSGGSKRKSRIVVVSSGAGKVPCPKNPSYGAAKHALHGFFDSLRLELEYKSIPVSITTVILGLIDTDTAVSLTKNDLEHMPMGKANDAALAIILGAQARVEELYYPVSQQLHLTSILRSIPGLRYVIDRFLLLVLL